MSSAARTHGALAELISASNGFPALARPGRDAGGYDGGAKGTGRSGWPQRLEPVCQSAIFDRPVANEKWPLIDLRGETLAVAQEQDINSLFRRGWALCKARQSDLALPLLQRVRALAPELAAGHFAAGHALTGEAAAAAFGRALALNPGWTEARYNLAMLAYRAERYGEAAALFADVVAERPAWHAARFRLGMAHFRQGHYAVAAAELTAAARGMTAADPLFEKASITALMSRGRAIGLTRDVLPTVDRIDPGLRGELAARSQAAWRNNRLDWINVAKIVVPCLSCGNSAGNRIVAAVPLVDGLALFAADDAQRHTIYALDRRGCADYGAAIEATLGAIQGSSQIYYALCSCCGVYYQNFPHTPEALAAYYGYWMRLPYLGTATTPHGRAHSINWAYPKFLTARHLWTRCGLQPGAPVLEVGCAEGLALWYLDLLGARIEGVEPAEANVAYARDVLGLAQIRAGTYAADMFARAAFEAVLCHHVLEHVLDPVGMLTAMARHLKPGGHLLLQGPSADRGHDGALGGMGSTHLYLFSRDYLHEMLARLGFAIVESFDFGNVADLPAALRSPAKSFSIAGDTGQSISILARRIAA